MDMTGLAEVSTDTLERELVRLEAVVASARARQMGLLSEVDRRQVAMADGCRSLVEWVSGRVDVCDDTARRLVQTGRRLTDLPNLADSLAWGEVSFDRVEQVARIATAGTETETLADSYRWDLRGLQRRVGHHRRITREEERRGVGSRELVFQHSLDSTVSRLWGRMPGTDAVLIEGVLTERADRYPALPDGTTEPRGARMASALVELCTTGTAHPEGPDPTPVPVLTVTVDAALASSTGGEAGASVTAGPRVGPDTLEELLCSGYVEVNLHTAAGDILGVGDSRQGIPPRLRRAVISRDQGCVIAGCGSRYRLQVHHLTQRSHGGTHHPSNLATVCWYHHHVVIHGRGHRIDPHSPPGARRLTPPTTNRAPP